MDSKRDRPMDEIKSDDLEYGFEAGGRAAFRDKQRASREKTRLERRLGFTDEQPAAAYAELLLELTVHCHLAIDWYQHKLKREIRARRWYFFLSLGLLALIPIALFLLVPESDAKQTTAAVITAQISAVLTGLLAFQRGVSAWLDRRQVVGGYSKAVSELKAILYEFEQTWQDCARDVCRGSEFKAAIKQAIGKCRTVVRVETDGYFQTLSYPSLDLGSLVKSATADATEIVRSYVPAVATQREVTAAKLEQLRRRVGELDQELARARAGQSGDVDSIRSARDGVLRELRAAELSPAKAALL